MAFAQSGVANGVEQRHKGAELFDAFLDDVGHFFGAGDAGKVDAELHDLRVHRVRLGGHLLRVQLLCIVTVENVTGFVSICFKFSRSEEKSSRPIVFSVC